jgi:hypothetical protein
MKIEYEWHAGDGRGRMETITKNQGRQRWPWWRWVLLILLGGALGAALAYSGYAVFT